MEWKNQNINGGLYASFYIRWQTFYGNVLLVKIYWTFTMCKVLSASQGLWHLILTRTSWGRYNDSCFTKRDTKVKEFK